MDLLSVIFIVTTALLASCECCCVALFAFPSPPPPPSWVAHAIEHLLSPPPPLQATPLEELSNIRIPVPTASGTEILAYEAMPSGYYDAHKNQEPSSPLPSIILIHEFFGLNPSIIEKAQALSNALNCRVIAPDTFRGDVTNFIPKAIWLALTTPQERVNDDLDAVYSYLESENSQHNGKVAVMGFCYGGGKAIRYTSTCRPDAATVVFYGSPVTDVDELKRLKAPVCGVYGSQDAQFPKTLLDKFQSALNKAGVENDVRVYDGVGHAFWSDMEQIERGDRPQEEAYGQCISFLRRFFDA